MSIFGYGRSLSSGKEQGMKLLREQNVIKAVLSFSGGNDEGGVTDCLLYTEGEEEPRRINQNYGSYGEWVENPEAGPAHRKFVAREATPQELADDELCEILGQPVDDKYGSWAGEFEAYGTLTWDVVANTVLLDENVSTPSYDRHSDSW